MQSAVLLQVLLALVVGLWFAAKFKDSPIINFFGKNDWFIGLVFILVGYANYTTYVMTSVQNLNLVLILIGAILVMFSIIDMSKNK